MKYTSRSSARMLRLAKKRLKELGKEKKPLLKKQAQLRAQADEIEKIANALESGLFNLREREGNIVEVKQDLGEKMGTANVTGFWIVSKNDGIQVQLRHFYSLIGKQEAKVQTITLPVMQDTTGSDGKRVSFDVGDMLTVTQPGDSPMFHFSNVGPGSKEGEFEYKQALAKLGIGMMPEIKEGSYLINDGGFMKLN